MASFDFKSVEKDVREFWAANSIRDKVRAKAQASPKKYYFLDGPPYTSGHVHIGTAWNKSLKDMFIRYHRMKGDNVWDRAGYDMHGLPTERATEKELQVFGRDAILAYGRDAFIEKCKELCLRNMKNMTESFEYLGVWMDFQHPYQTISREYMEGVWYFIKRCQEEGRLYEAEKTMTWDAVNATALAKHELEYKKVTDTSIFVRFRVADKFATDGLPTYLVIWTTTPWTIPFNLGVMAGPDIEYARVVLTRPDEGKQSWIVAVPCIGKFLSAQLKLEETDFQVVWKGKGKDLAGIEYIHPFARHTEIYAKLKQTSARIHTVLMSSQFVDTESGTGLVHCAPGCGPEDYTVGRDNGIAPFNTVDVNGVTRDLPPVTGLLAKKDDAKFIQLIAAEGALVHKFEYEHEYPFGERSKEPVIFRTTRQWFVKVDDIKSKLLEANEGINWYPTAAKNAFTAWLQNLQANSVSKQRFWGTPLPIWRNVDNEADYIVVSTADELCKLAGLPAGTITDLHPPVVDKIEIKRDGHVYRRVPDVLDVWVDAGAASWNCLRMPDSEPQQKREDWGAAEFILEGRDQIRGWYNLLHLESMIATGKPCFKNVYMHGFIVDATGRKMSKSSGNYIVPSEVWNQYGVDALRYYAISSANPGFDLNYNMADVRTKTQNLGVFWNIHNYLLVTAEAASSDVAIAPHTGELGLEERYILSRLHRTIRDVTEMFETFKLNQVPGAVEVFLLELSHVYIQLIWEKKDAGTPAEKAGVVSTLAECFLSALTMMATFAPFITEKMYQDIRAAMPAFCPAESAHLVAWPQCDVAAINQQLEDDINAAKDAVTAVLAARDRANLAVKQPSRDIRVDCPPRMIPMLGRTSDLICSRTNAKALHFGAPEATVTVAVNLKTVGKSFRRDNKRVSEWIEKNAAAIAASLKALPAGAHWAAKVNIEGTDFDLTEEHIVLSHGVASNWTPSKLGEMTVFLDTTRTEELEAEGHVRELARKIQMLRKAGGLKRSEKAVVEVLVPASNTTLIAVVNASITYIRDRTSCAEVRISPVADPAKEITLKTATRATAVEKVGKTSVALALF